MKNIVIVILLGAYSLFFSEWFLRFLNPQAIMPRFIQAGEFGIRENVPNAQYRHWTPEIKVNMQTNSQGMRDYREYSVAKPEGACRVAIFGDSFFMGYEVTLEDSYAGRLEIDLNEGGKPCEVLNFAVSGFGTAESLITLQEKALAFDPDYVVLEWHHTDPKDNLRSGLFRLNQDGVLEPTGRDYLPGVKVRERLMAFGIYRWAIENSHLYNIAREKIAGSIKDLINEIRNFSFRKKVATDIEDIVEPQKTYSVDINVSLVNRFCELVRLNDAVCIISDMPSQNFRDEIESSFDFIDVSKIDADAVLSPVDLFEQAWNEGNHLFRYQGHNHFNELGYQLAASVVSEYILSQD